MNFLEYPMGKLKEGFKKLGFGSSINLGDDESFQQYYKGYRWYLINHHRVGPVLNVVPPISGSAYLPWETWYLDNGRETHHVHFTERKAETDFTWIEQSGNDERPPEVLGKVWYWYDEPNLQPFLINRIPKEQKRPFDAVGFGSCSIDFRIFVPDLGPGYSGKFLAQRVETYDGGVIANALTQLTRLGRKTGWFGKMGADTFGRMMMQRLGTEGVDTTRVIWLEGKQSPFNVVIYMGDDCRRQGGYMLPNITREFGPADVTRIVEYLEAAEYLITEVSQYPLRNILAVVAAARRSGTKIILDIDVNPVTQGLGSMEELDALLSMSDVLAPNIEVIKEVYRLNSSRIDEWAMRRISQGAGLVVVSQGDEGCTIYDRRQVVRCPGFVINNPVDTVGAGDAFHGGMVYGLLQGWNLEQIALFANACGALNCQSKGPRGGMAVVKEIEKFISNHAQKGTIPTVTIQPID